MAASLIGWIWRQEVGATAKLVLFALNEHANIGKHGDWKVYPGQERIAKMCGVSKPTVIKAMKELTEAGVITVAHQHDSMGRQLQNLYWLQAPKLIEEEGLKNFTPQLKNLTHGGKESLHKSLNRNPLNKTNTRASMFDAWWKLYPRKAGKKRARKLFEKLSSSDLKDCLADNASLRYKGRSKEHIPQADTYLSQNKWEDEQDHASAQPKQRWL